MRISELKSKLEPFGISVHEQDTLTQLIKWSNVIGTIRETDELAVRMNRKFIQLVDKDKAEIEKAIFEYACTPLEDRNDFVVHDYLIPAVISKKYVLFMTNDGKGTAYWDKPFHIGERRSIDLDSAYQNRMLRVYARDSNIIFTSRQVEVLKNSVDSATAKMIDANKILIFNHSQHGGY